MCEPRKPAPPLIRQVLMAAARIAGAGGIRRAAPGLKLAWALQPPIPIARAPRSSCSSATATVAAARRSAPLALRRGRRRRAPARLADPADQGAGRRPGPADRLDGRWSPSTRRWPCAAGASGCSPAWPRRTASTRSTRSPRALPAPAERAERAERVRRGPPRSRALKANERLRDRAPGRRATPTPRSASAAAGPTRRSTAVWPRGGRRFAPAPEHQRASAPRLGPVGPRRRRWVGELPHTGRELAPSAAWRGGCEAPSARRGRTGGCTRCRDRRRGSRSSSSPGRGPRPSGTGGR